MRPPHWASLPQLLTAIGDTPAPGWPDGFAGAMIQDNNDWILSRTRKFLMCFAPGWRTDYEATAAPAMSRFQGRSNLRGPDQSIGPPNRHGVRDTLGRADPRQAMNMNEQSVFV